MNRKEIPYATLPSCDAQEESQDKSPVTPTVEPASCWQRAYYCGPIRYVPAFFCSAGKVGQAAGQDILGINKVLADFGSTSRSFNLGLLTVLVAINVFINVSTRANKIFEYFLLAKVYWTDDIEDLASKVDISKSYVIDANEKKLYKVDVDPHKRNEVPLSDVGQQKLEALCESIQQEIVMGGADALPLVSASFKPQHYSQLNEVLRNGSFPDDWGCGARSWFYFLATGCFVSTLFSAMSAYLSGVTLINQAPYPSSPGVQIAFGVYIMACATIAYLSFNFDTMLKFVTRFCTSWNNGMTKGDFGIPVGVMSLTIALSILGVIASAGMAYFSARNSVAILPGIEHWTDEEKDVVVFTNVGISFFPSIFNFAAGCYNQLLKASEAKSSVAATRTTVTCAIALLVLIDSIANCFGTFIGTRDLLELLFNKEGSETHSKIIFGASFVASASNAFLNFGMTMTGTEDTFKKWNEYAYGPNAADERQALLSGDAQPSEAGDVEAALPSAPVNDCVGSMGSCVARVQAALQCCMPSNCSPY